MKTTLKVFLLVSTLLGAALVFAADHPNFTGKWQLNVARSETASSGVTELVVEVDHKDPVFAYTAKGTAGGQEFEESETLTTDGKPSRDSHGANVTAVWDGNSLVEEGTADDGSHLFTSRLTMSEDGKTITRVFSQQSDTQVRHEIYEKQ